MSSRFPQAKDVVRLPPGNTRLPSGRFDILIIAIIALVIVVALINVLLQIIGHSEEHVEKVRKTKITYEEALRWRSGNEIGESRIASDLERDPNRLTANYSDSSLNENCLRLVGRMSRLRELKLTRSTVKSSWLAHITSLPLNTLGLHGTQIDDTAIRYILKIPTLTNLAIGDTEVTDHGLKRLSESRSILYLSLNVGRRFTNSGIKYISQMPQLISLDLGDATSLDGSCLAHLTSMPHLTSLNLENVRISDDDIRHLAAFKDLRHLNLTNCRIDDSRLAEITKIGTLLVLNLAGNDISDKRLGSLSKLTRLNHLTLKACPSVSGAAVTRLRAAMPHCNITYSDRTRFAEKLSRTGVDHEIQLLENEAKNAME